MTYEYYAFMFVNGLSNGMLLFIIASGLSLVSTGRILHLQEFRHHGGTVWVKTGGTLWVKTPGTLWAKTPGTLWVKTAGTV